MPGIGTMISLHRYRWFNSTLLIGCPAEESRSEPRYTLRQSSPVEPV